MSSIAAARIPGPQKAALLILGLEEDVATEVLRHLDDDELRCLAEYTDKCHLISVEGRVSSGKYTNDAGETVYTMDVAVARCDFLARPKGTVNTPNTIDDETEAA